MGRLMRENSIPGHHKRRYKATTDSRHSPPVAENLLARDIFLNGPNQFWLNATLALPPVTAGSRRSDQALDIMF